MKKIMSFLFSPSADGKEKNGHADVEKPKETEKISNGIRPDLKKTMDAYEAFFAEYIHFMKIYQKTQNVAQIMDEYTDYTKRYTQAMAALQEIGLKKLTDEEMVYYTEVMSRISDQLAKSGI